MKLTVVGFDSPSLAEMRAGIRFKSVPRKRFVGPHGVDGMAAGKDRHRVCSGGVDGHAIRES